MIQEHISLVTIKLYLSTYRVFTKPSIQHQLKLGDSQSINFFDVNQIIVYLLSRQIKENRLPSGPRSPIWYNLGINIAVM